MWNTVYEWLVVLWNVPNGSMWSNLFSSPVTWLIVAVGSGRVLKVLHTHHEEKLDQAERHHAAMMKKITSGVPDLIGRDPEELK